MDAVPQAPSPGWYPDPVAPGAVRWFDGSGWTPHVSPAPPVAGGYAPLLTAAAAGIGATPADPVHWLLPTGRTWQSIVAGYVALVAVFVWFLGPVALLLGVAALRASAAGRGHGRGRAWFAVVVGSAATLAGLALVASWL